MKKLTEKFKDQIKTTVNKLVSSGYLADEILIKVSSLDEKNDIPASAMGKCTVEIVEKLKHPLIAIQ